MDAVGTPAGPAEVREAEVARLVARLAALTAAAERAEEAWAAALAGRPASPGPRRRALLIVNRRAGAHDVQPELVTEVVAALAAGGVDAEVRTDLAAPEATAAAAAAGAAGVALVVAAGGDGTVGAVAAGLVGTRTTLGIVPLGTYNNVAASLGIPTEVGAACALIGVGATRSVDAGQVRAQGGVPHLFLESATVGLAAALVPAGEAAKEGRWARLVAELPTALLTAPATARVVLDGAAPAGRATTLLVHVANTPRTSTALPAAPRARLDDGLLDVAVYRDMGPTELALRFLQLRAGVAAADPRIARARAQRITIDADPPLPVAADATLIGTTPAEIRVLPGALRVIAGDGPGLCRPVSTALVAAAAARAQLQERTGRAQTAEPPPAVSGPESDSLCRR